MMPSSRRSASIHTSVTLAALALALLGGCTTPIALTTNPPGATAYVGDKSVGVTPTQFEGAKPVPIELRLDGYFPESFIYQPDPNQHAINIQLAPTTLTKSYDLASAPADAIVRINGEQVGTTPLSGVKVVFTRDDKNSPWREKTLTIAKLNYQTESLMLNAANDSVSRVDLSLLKDDRTYTVTATTTDGAELNAEVSVNGTVVGQTPLKLPITFQRPNKLIAWPKFNLTVDVSAKYKPATAVIDYNLGPVISFKLEPITEITTTLYCPATVMTPTGVAFKIMQSNAIAILNTREPAEIVADLKPITNFTRKDLKESAATRADSINSFCVTPDGQHVIFGLTAHDDQGNYYSNLYIKQADDAASGVAQLTPSDRYWDATPDIANDGSNYLVFASNRSDRNKPDIFRVSLVDNRLSGGISRLTNDLRFNFEPTYGDSNRQLFYLSIEPNFPLADFQISSVRFDGSLPTQLSTNAIEVNNTFADKVFFTRIDPDTKKKQIYSMTADGKLETALVNQEGFRQANCFEPAVSPDGGRVLFVSDRGTDDQGRHNNDIYIVNSDGTNLQGLTRNGSDDIMPAWSPSEEGVIYFLSNRGGAYNIWRMKLTRGTK
jgi:Tol biopolymer transport system component